ncbi:MAG: hypothetical protein K2O06_05945 [Acetatifactor sp.]|nr:hypothetical protein [Acetatifactor sp.]
MKKEKALSRKWKQKPGGCKTAAVAVLLVLSLLTGCSRERMETGRRDRCGACYPGTGGAVSGVPGYRYGFRCLCRTLRTHL